MVLIFFFPPWFFLVIVQVFKPDLLKVSKGGVPIKKWFISTFGFF